MDLLESGLASKKAIAAFKKHAISSYPNECVGYINNAGDIYTPLVNVSETPTHAAIVDPKIMLGLEKSGAVGVYCHSHPDGPDCPSHRDMDAQKAKNCPFAIISTDGTSTLEPFVWTQDMHIDMPLEGRPFRHGLTDCYEVVRSYYWQKHGLKLNAYARGWAWWEGLDGKNESLYEKYFEQEGFYDVDTSDIRVGDGALLQIHSAMPNHAVVCVGGGLMLHHLCGESPANISRVSKIEPIGRWSKYIKSVLRHDGVKQ